MTYRVREPGLRPEYESSTKLREANWLGRFRKAPESDAREHLVAASMAYRLYSKSPSRVLRGEWEPSGRPNPLWKTHYQWQVNRCSIGQRRRHGIDLSIFTWTVACFPLLFLGFNKGATNVDANLYIQQAIEGLRTQTAAHSETWHLGEEESWAADQDEGCVEFSFADRTVAEADMQIIGTYNTLDGTFLWGWDHPSVKEPLRTHAKLARAFGEKHGLSTYTDRTIECTEEEAWELTAVAARLGNANGAYRGPAGTVLVYMTFGAVKLHKP